MDNHDELFSSLGLEPGTEGETPSISRDNSGNDSTKIIARLSASWSNSLLSVSQEGGGGGGGGGVQEEDLTFRNMFSSPSKQSISDEQQQQQMTPSSSRSSSRMEQDDQLHVEKSRILELLRHMTSEVDQLESRLQAVRRKRARSAASAIQKQQDMQESEAQEMRQILGSVHQMSIVDESKGQNSGRPKTNTPLSSQSANFVDVDMIRRLQSFTNIAFTSIEHHNISTLDPHAGGRQYRMTGLCFQLEFSVEFTVHDPNLDLSNVRIKIPRSASTELGQFISRVQNESLLLPFFRTLSQYAQMDHDRQTVMDNLAKRFPKLLKTNHAITKLSKAPRLGPGNKNTFTLPRISPAGPGVQSLTFCGARKSSPELVFHWVIDVSDKGKIIPRVRLLPRMSKKWKQADEKATLDAIPTQFVRLLQLKGTEGAVAILLQCVYGRHVVTGTKEDVNEGHLV
ncbi:hypothetical protein BGZ49_000596 [Haplosporangium sp. Z 27]|nr:hypothetical protein BGZ49_000596 [Haplosporangium sp. Z 27]